MAITAGLRCTLNSPYSQASLTLSGVPDDGAFVRANLLHPAAIWNRASLSLASALASVAQGLQRVSQPGAKPPGMKNEMWLQLLRAQERALSELHQLVNEAFSALVAASPKASPRPSPKTENHAWLERLHAGPKRAFWGDVSNVLADVGALVNRFKHAGCSLSPFIARTPNEVLPGYYLQGTSWEGGIGPDPVVHPEATCFSFARDFRLRVFQFALIDRAVSTAAISMNRETGAQLGEPRPELAKSQIEWREVLSFASSLPRFVLPDEAQKPFPAVERQGGRRAPSFFLETKVGGGRFNPMLEFTFIGSGDDATKHGKLPYVSGINGPYNLAASM